MLRCDFSKRNSTHGRAHNAACSHQSCTLCPVFETTCKELNDALVAVVGNWPHLRVRVAEFGPNHSQRAKVALLLPNPFDALVLYTTQAALDEIAYAHRAPLVQQLVWPLGAFDSVVHHLAQPLLSSLERPLPASKIFLDHVLQALNSHLVCSYGGVRMSAPKFRGGLSLLQMRRATELLEAHLDGDIALRQVAEVCELSVSHFARAFKQTFNVPPYRWLIERRVDRARDLMTNSRLPLAGIAIRCGFADRSAFNRSLDRIHGLTPGIWRRTRAAT